MVAPFWRQKLDQTGPLCTITNYLNKPYTLGLGYEHVYLGPHMHAMFSYSGDSTISAPQQDKIYLRSYLNTDKAR